MHAYVINDDCEPEYNNVLAGCNWSYLPWIRINVVDVVEYVEVHDQVISRQ